MKRCVWAVAIGLVLAGGAWNSAAGLALDLTKLKSVCLLVEDLPADAKRDFGLSKNSIMNHVYVWLKGKLPRLRVERFTGALREDCSPGKPIFYAKVSIGVVEREGMMVWHYGYVAITMTRETTWGSGRVGLGIAYFNITRMGGPTGGVRAAVNEQLERLLTDFAAEYYKAGNP